MSTNALCLALLVAGFCEIALYRGPDASWDYRNYHLYAPFAILHDKFGYDLAPAQMQTFLAPMLDLIVAPVRVALNHRPHLLNAVLAVPHGVAAFLAFAIGREMLRGCGRMRVPFALVAAGIGATGAAGLPTLAASDSDMIPASFLLASVLLLLGQLGAASNGRLVLAGAFMGVAVGLKLTFAPFCLGAGVALLASMEGRLLVRLRRVAVVAVGGVVVLAIVAGPWWLTLYRHYDNPLFPLFNKWFQSPYYDPVNLSDDRFKPHNLAQALFFPFFWAVRASSLVTELPMRDPRFALAALGLLAAVLVTTFTKSRYHRYCLSIRFTRRSVVATRNTLLCDRIPRRVDPRTVFFVVFFAVGYVVWEIVFSIQRYLAPLELLSGVAMLLPFRPLLTSPARQNAAVVALVLLLFGLVRFTIYPDWGHAAWGPQAVDVRLPRLPANSLVIMLDPAPMAYLAAFAPASVRFVGAQSNLMHPGDHAGLPQAIEDVIRSHQGPLWGMESPSELPGEADATLRYYGLARILPGCSQVHSNLDSDEIRLCPLVRE